MRILFLEIDTDSTWAVASIGVAYLAAYLRDQGHEVTGWRVAPEAAVADVLQVIDERAPQLIGLSLTTRQWLRAREVVAEIRQHRDIPIIAGGLHPTFSPEQVLAAPGFDFVCLGEGETAMAELVERIESGRLPAADDNDEIPNIWIRGHARPALRAPFSPVDGLPFMARDLLDEHHGVVHMTTQRGCPFPCSYCAAGQYHQLYGKTSEYGRRRSHQNVLDELAQIESDRQLSYVIFLDDTFTIYPTWVAEFCRLYGERFRVPFSIHARADTVSEEMIEQLATAGCRHIVYGVESGSYRLRSEMMHRPITNEQMIDVFAVTKRAGIMVTANYMMGLPSETKDDLEQTLQLHHRLDPDDFGYFVFYPYPGTQLFRVCVENNLLPDNYQEFPAVHRESILNLPDLTREDIARCYDRFTELRIAKQLERLGPDADAETVEGVRANTTRCAAMD